MTGSVRRLLAAMAVGLVAVGCRSADPAASGPSTRPPLFGTSWIVEEIDGRRALEGVPSTLSFDSGQQYSGHAACNHYFGRLSGGEGTAVTLTSAATTRRTCASAVMDQERRFLSALPDISRYRRSVSRLLLLEPEGRVRVVLAPAPATDGTGPAAGLQPSALAQLRAQVFACAEGPTFTLTLPVDTAGLIELTAGGSRHQLSHVRTASGTRYADEAVSVWTKGPDATLEQHGRTHACREDRERSIIEDARLRGVDFRATGHAPGWTLELLAERLDFLGGYEAGAVTAPRPAPRPAPATGETVYSAVTDAHRIVVHIRETWCLDALSGTRLESSVEVELNGTAYRGCGQRVR